MKRLFSIIILLVVISCNEVYEAPETEPIKSKPNDSGEKSNPGGQQKLETDSAYLEKLLDSAMKLANKQKRKNSFKKIIDTNAYNFNEMYAIISFGNLFSDDKKHLIVQRFINEFSYEQKLYSDIYLLNNNSFTKVAADTSENGYEKNFFEDLNHDNYKDYVVQSYSKSGGCPRNFEVVFLYNSKNGHFNSFELFNREFDSLSPVFYETSYGLGDFITLYKYKWAGMKKQLLEEITITKNDSGEKPSTYTKIIYPGMRKQRIKNLPIEYKKLKMAEYITQIN